jgi:hypothetical protein
MLSSTIWKWPRRADKSLPTTGRWSDHLCRMQRLLQRNGNFGLRRSGPRSVRDGDVMVIQPPDACTFGHLIGRSVTDSAANGQQKPYAPVGSGRICYTITHSVPTWPLSWLTKLMWIICSLLSAVCRPQGRYGKSPARSAGLGQLAYYCANSSGCVPKRELSDGALAL